MDKKGVSPAGFLLIMIVTIIIAALISSVVIQNASFFSQKGNQDSKSAGTLASTSLQMMQISASDGSDGNFENFDIIYRLGPGSGTVQLDTTYYTESTINSTSALQFRENGLPINDVIYGYYTATSHAFANASGSFSDEVPSAFRTSFASPDTSEFMAGKIAVAIIMPESNGSIDSNDENWTDTEQDAMIQAAADALNWWSNVEPRAGIRHTFEIYTDIPISYEPATRGTDLTNSSLWITEALDYMGVPDPGGNVLDRTRQMADRLRNNTNAHWAFVAFVVDSSNTGSFGDGFAGVAYVQGPHTLIASDGFPGRPEVLMAHEFAHIFGALDEYASSGCACTDTSGIGPYYSVETQNCENSCLTNTTSIMRAGADAITAYDNNLVSVFTLGQMGLINTNYNYKIDAIDLIFESDDEDVNVTQFYINNLSLNGYRNPSLARESVGFYVAQDAQSGSYTDQFIRSRMTRIFHESARPLVEEETVKISVNPQTGSAYIEEFYTPYTITQKNTILHR